MDKKLRSERWFETDDLRGFGHRSRLFQMGYDEQDQRGKPVIALINTWSDINPCHRHLRDRAEHIKRGVLQAGGFPLEIPVQSVPEIYTKPSPLMYRNFLAMEVEEVLRSLPVDGAVLMGGCDKTTPGLLMGAFSANLPTIYFPAGPMLKGRYHGEVLGSGSDSWKYWDKKRAGTLSAPDWKDIETGIARTDGHCMTMGTASTMTGITEALGLTLAGASSIPAPDADHIRMASATGRAIVEAVQADRTPKTLLSAASFGNGLAVAMAMGCSTNAIIHLIAMARRADIALSLSDFEAASARVPVLANVRPIGAGYLMEDFFHAGGLRALMSEMGDLIDTSVRTITGQTVAETLAGAQTWNSDVIRPRSNPVSTQPALAVLRGNLAPDGCVIKPAAADPNLLHHIGPALVFEGMADLKARIEDPDLEVTKDTVLILRGAGPEGAPGMPEWGMIPIPAKLLKDGVRDMVRLSDARMSGTSYGTCVLHMAPEAHVGGPLALVRTGDLIELDVAAGRLNMQVSEADIAARRAQWQRPAPQYHRGFGWLFVNHVRQANEGCDFDFLETSFGDAVDEPVIF
ncbi:MAG: dihydroxy-acid dehydratase [Thalassovita sp.]